jgi:hypothetical protein
MTTRERRLGGSPHEADEDTLLEAVTVADMTVQKVAGMTPDEYRAALRQLGLRPSNVSTVDVPGRPRGRRGVAHSRLAGDVQTAKALVLRKQDGAIQLQEVERSAAAGDLQGIDDGAVVAHG